MAERDLLLIRETLEGDRNAFGDLVERYGRLVRGVIWETLRPRVVAQVAGFSRACT